MPLNENAARWVRELESGEYEQGTYYLRKGDRYCCLGVACELAAREGVIPEPALAADGTWEYSTHDDPSAQHTAGLPDEVRSWLGLRSDLGYWDGCNKGLAAMNDSGASFEEIARTIRNRPPGLFEEED